MSIEALLAGIAAATGDPARLSLATLDVVLALRGEPELRSAVHAAAIPHWFNAEILACCTETDHETSERIFARLQTLPMVETFAARGGMNVHEATRLALRDHLLNTDPDRFHRLSSRAANCFEGDAPHLLIEALYHRLVTEPVLGAEALRQLCLQWDSAGKHEVLQSLAVVLEELVRNQTLAPGARAQCIVRLCEIRGDSLPAQQAEALGREAQSIMIGDSDAAGLCDCVNLVGVTLERQGRLPDALNQYRQQMDICHAEIRRNPENAYWRRELSVSHNCVGRILQAQGKLQDALAEYQAGKQIRQELTARDPDNAGWRRELSVSHNCVGGILQAQGKLQDALAEYQADKQIMQELTARDPDNAGWRRELSVSHNCVGSVLQAQGKLQDALAEYQAGKQIMQELTARDPDNAGWRSDLRLAQLRRRDPAGAGQAAGRAGGVPGVPADRAGADRARSGQCRLAARSFPSRTIASAGSCRRRASCRTRWRRTRCTSRSCRSRPRAIRTMPAGGASFPSRTIASAAFCRRRASCRTRWRSTRPRKASCWLWCRPRRIWFNGRRTWTSPEGGSLQSPV